ncbi:MAG: TolC family protein [Cyanobacteria bacterium]|nr:TolC family protein [Cyanobacteriota bacterium]
MAAFRSGLASSRAALGETERQLRFDLVSAYRDLQLRQALIPFWEKALEASTALERDAEAIRRRGLAARIDVLRREGPEGSTVARIAAGSAAGPDQPAPGRPVGHVALPIAAGGWGPQW